MLTKFDQRGKETVFKLGNIERFYEVVYVWFHEQRNFNVEYTSNFKGVFRHINLEIYKIYLKLKKPPINRKFLIEIRKDFDSRPRSRIKDSNYLNLPTMKMFETRYTTNGDVEDIVRSVRRGIKEVEKTLLNVCQGKFP